MFQKLKFGNRECFNKPSGHPYTKIIKAII